MVKLSNLLDEHLKDFYGHEINIGDWVVAIVDLWGSPDIEKCRLEPNGSRDGVRGYAFLGKIDFKNYQFVLNNMISVQAYYQDNFVKNPITMVPLKYVSKILARVPINNPEMENKENENGSNGEN